MDLSHIVEPLRPLAVPVADLSIDPRNARRHPERNVEAVRASLLKFGQRLPIVVQRQGMIVRAGNCRLEVARALGWTHIAAVVVDEADAEAAAWAIADNRTPELAEWDDRTLAEILKALPGELMLATGFTGQDLAELLAAAAPKIEDVPPDPPARPVSRPGDIWLLGNHRIACGDSTDPKLVLDLVAGERWDLMVTDPPYGVDYQGGQNAKKRERLAGDAEASIYGRFLPVWMVHRAKKGCVYLWFAGSCGLAPYQAAADVGLEVRALLIWNKLDPHYGAYMAQYMQKHEPCLYLVGDGTDWHGPSNEITVWDIKQPARNELHPTQKPVECMRRGIENSTRPGALVADPFSGSGTTIVACEQSGRRCIAVELAPQYVDVAVLRWQALTNRKATLEGGSLTFDEVQVERSKPAPQAKPVAGSRASRRSSAPAGAKKRRARSS
jgi:DNA modification methylase